jgi:hypothetical protein
LRHLEAVFLLIDEQRRIRNTSSCWEDGCLRGRGVNNGNEGGDDGDSDDDECDDEGDDEAEGGNDGDGGKLPCLPTIQYVLLERYHT